MNFVLRRVIAAMLLLSFTGCTTWTTTQAPLTALDGRTVRVTTHGDESHEGLLMHPDTLGSKVLIRGHDPAVLLVVDSAEVAKIETRQVHAGRTAGLVLLSVGVVLVIAAIQLASIFNDVDY